MTKEEGVPPNMLLYNGITGLLKLVLQCCPGAAFIPSDTSMAPVKTVEEVPTDCFRLFKLYSMDAKWTLETRPKREGDEKKGPGKIYGTVYIQADCNVKDLVEALRYDLVGCGYDLSWKQVQARQSIATLTIFGLSDRLCPLGIKQTLSHIFTVAEQDMIRAGKQSLDFKGEPLPEFACYFKRSRQGNLPGDVHASINLESVPGFKERGCRLLVVECAPEAMGRMGPVWEY